LDHRPWIRWSVLQQYQSIRFERGTQSAPRPARAGALGRTVKSTNRVAVLWYCYSTAVLQQYQSSSSTVVSFVFERGTQSSPRAPRLEPVRSGAGSLGSPAPGSVDMETCRAVTARLRRASRRGHGAGDPTRSQPRAPLTRPGLRHCVPLKHMQPTSARRSATASTRSQPRATRLAGWGR
jgi:hypothetical protein